MHVEVLSSGYYLTELYIEEGEEAPRINDYNYRDLQTEVHTPGSGEQDIIFQMDGVFFTVEPSQGIPIGVMELPEEAMEMIQVKNPPTRREVMIPKPWMFRYLRVPQIQ